MYIVIFHIVNLNCKKSWNASCCVRSGLSYYITSHVDNSADKLGQNNIIKNFLSNLFKQCWHITHTDVAVNEKWNLSALLKQWTQWSWKHEYKVCKRSFVSLNFQAGFWRGLNDTMCIMLYGSWYHADTRKINIAIYCHIIFLAKP